MYAKHEVLLSGSRLVKFDPTILANAIVAGCQSSKWGLLHFLCVNYSLNPQVSKTGHLPSLPLSLFSFCFLKAHKGLHIAIYRLFYSRVV